jgi:hypothetical protein
LKQRKRFDYATDGKLIVLALYLDHSTFMDLVDSEFVFKHINKSVYKLNMSMV